MNKIVVANWKMNGSREQVSDFLNYVNNFLLDAESNTKAVISFPYIYLYLMYNIKGSRIFSGAQDCFHKENGSYTGCISANMLKDMGCQYVILGHSERREILGEDMGIISSKITKVLDMGMIPIFCVGNKDRGCISVVLDDLDYIISNVGDRVLGKDFIVAYEPIYSIGTGEVASTDDILNVISEIKENKNFKNVLYGGSVKSNNIKDILSTSVDGVLIGKASLDKVEFCNIIESCSE